MTTTDELVERIASRTGVEHQAARRALGLIIGFLLKEGPEEETNRLVAALPGARDLLAEEDSATPRPPGWAGSLGGLMGMNGLMGLANRLTHEAGLGLDGMKGAAEEVFAFAREAVDPDYAAKLGDTIPALKPFL